MTNATERGGVCRRCRKGNVTPHAVESVYEHEGTTVRFMDEFMRCDRCEHEFYSPEQSMARSRAITSAIRKHEGLPTGEEIRAARLSFDLSLAEFERALGVGKNTVGRWERGTVPPSSSANLGLWIAMTKPTAFVEWAALRGVSIGPARNRTAAALTTGSGPSAPTLTLADGGRARTPRSITTITNGKRLTVASAGNEA